MALILGILASTILIVGCTTSRVAARVGTLAPAVVVMVAATTSIGVGILTDRGQAEPSTFAIHLGGTVAFSLGLCFFAGRWRGSRRRGSVPSERTAPFLATCMAIVAVSIAIQLITVGLPTFSARPEDARWEAGGDILLGVPSRLASIGAALLFVFGTTQFGVLPAVTRRRFVAFAALVALYTAGLGFRSSLLELGVYAAIGTAAALRLRVNVRTLSRALVLLVPALVLFGYLTTRYTSETARRQSSDGVASAFVERVTVGTARSGTVLLEAEPADLGYEDAASPLILSEDAASLVRSYLGVDASSANRLNERLSARIARADPEVRVEGAIAPATPGAVAVAVYLSGVPLAYLLLASIGLLLRWSLVRLNQPRSPERHLCALAAVYVIFEILLKGNIEYQIVNVAAVTVFLALTGRVGSRMLNRRRVSLSRSARDEFVDGSSIS